MIDRMYEEDIHDVLRLEKECFSDPWTEELIRSSESTGMDVYLVLREDTGIVGYCIFRILAGEGELFRIGVAKEHRGRGYGKKLMDAMVAYSKASGVAAISLEVREGNEPALNLYKSFGFKPEAVRKGYYRDPEEDAIIMWRRGI